MEREALEPHFVDVFIKLCLCASASLQSFIDQVILLLNADKPFRSKADVEFLEQTIFTGPCSLYNILLGFCAFVCTHGPPQSLLVSLHKSLIDCAQVLDMYRTMAMRTNIDFQSVVSSQSIDTNQNYWRRCDQNVQQIIDEVNYTIGYVAYSLITSKELETDEEKDLG